MRMPNGSLLNVLTLLGVRIDGDRLRGSMATLEQIIEEVKKLPTEEKLRLRAALEQLTGNGEYPRRELEKTRERGWKRMGMNSLTNGSCLRQINWWRTAPTLALCTTKLGLKA